MKNKFKRLISYVSAVSLAVSMLCCEFPINTTNNYTCTAMAFSITDDYPTASAYVAESIIKGMIDFETGEPIYTFVTKYDDVSHRDYTYEQLAKNVMDDKVLLITSAMWDTFSKALDGKLSAIDTELRQEQVYEIFLADYLMFSEGSTSNKSALDKAGEFANKTMEVESKIMKKLLQMGIASDEEELIKLIESSDSLENEEIKTALSNLNYEKELQGYTKILGDIKKVASNAADYYKALAKAMALKEVNDERIEFLKKMADNAADIDDDAFVTAVNNIIDIIESSNESIALNQGAKTMATYAVKEMWIALKKSLMEYIPGLKAVQTTKEAMDYLFNSTGAAESNIRIVMQYTAGQYALRAMNTAYNNYATNGTEENAAVFNAAYKNYLAYQDYSSEWAKEFVYAHTLASATTVEDCLTALNSDINYCNSAIMFADRFEKLYNAYAYPNITFSDIQDTTESQTEEEIEDINTDTSYHSTYAIKQYLTLTGDMTINGDLNIYADIDLDGYTLTVNGNVLHKSGTITVNSGTLNVTGNYAMENTTKNNVGEIVYNECDAILNMTNDCDKVNISGNFTTHNLSDWGTGGVYLNSGTLTVGGDIWSDKGISTSSSYEHKTVLNGSGNQNVYANDCTFDNIEMTNPSKRSITWNGNLYCESLTSDMNIKSDNLNISYLDLNQYNMTITGDVTETGSVDLNGGILTIKGNLLNKSGEITVNNGTLNVTGNYAMENTTKNNVGEIVYNECDAILNMTNDCDKVNISGNFTTHNLRDLGIGGVYLNSGTLTVGGDIWSDKNVYSSSNYGHKTVLSGKSKQTVTLNSSNKFNILVLTKPLSNYTFSPDKCWNSLMMIETGCGDCNLDGEINVADAVTLQKWILGSGTLDCWQTADLCEDGRIDVFDMIMMRKLLVEKTK